MQLELDLNTWVFDLFCWTNGRVERRYRQGKEVLRLFLHSDSWRDIRNRKWDIIGPGWGCPLLRE